jgi:phosphoglycerate dehydrogenase-like enzyme
MMASPKRILITSVDFAKGREGEVLEACRHHNCQPIYNPHTRAMSAADICDLDRREPLAGILVFSSSDQIDRTVFSRCQQLEVVSRHGVGVENIDLDAATEFGVAVRTTTGLDDFQSVADLAFGLIITVSRHICASDRELRAGRWVRPTGGNVWGKTLGVIGLGRIGRAVVRRALGFDMQVLAHDPWVDPDSCPDDDVEMVTLADLLARSDFVSLHCPLTHDNENMIAAGELQRMKSGAFLINTARAGLVDQTALLNALEKGIISGAAVDVFLKEPALDDPLVTADLPNLVLTTHIGSSTKETLHQMDRVALQNALEVLGR